MNCDLCHKEAVEFLDLKDQPLANKYPTPEQFKDEVFHRVKVYFCPHCRNIQLDTKVSRETMFVDYYYLSSVNKALVEHYTKFAHTLKDAKFVLDIGSNDGISLKPLKEMGVKCLGIEPSINVSKIANDAGLDTMCAFFNAESAKEIEAKYGKPDVITGLSMFSHLQDPHVFIEDVKNLLADDGKFIVEVEYNRRIIEDGAFERFYLDRIFYFSVNSFHSLFKQHGMVLTDAETTPAHGGSLRVTAKKHGLSSPRCRVGYYSELDYLKKEVMNEFTQNITEDACELKYSLERYKQEGLKVAGYGCPARTSTITNFADIGPDLIEYIVDDSPLKQGRFSPGKHIPIVPLKPYLQPDIWVIFAHEYFDDIRPKLSGRFLFPIPPREVT